MNVSSARHFFDARVLQLLDDPGMIFFLNIMKSYIEAFEDISLTVADRIKKVKYFTYFTQNFT